MLTVIHEVIFVFMLPSTNITEVMFIKWGQFSFRKDIITFWISYTILSSYLKSSDMTQRGKKSVFHCMILTVNHNWMNSALIWGSLVTLSFLHCKSVFFSQIHLGNCCNWRCYTILKSWKTKLVVYSCFYIL